jgi:cytoskeletal protein RodZ
VFVPTPREAGDQEYPPNSPAAFCARLKAAREARGITLAAIAEATKISPFLLASLEENNVARWPGGIYRRAFFTAYVQAIDLPVEPTVSEFLALFPDDDTLALDPYTGLPAGADSGRLSLGGRPQRGAAQVRAAVIELTIVVLVALAAAWATDWNPWVAAIVVGAWYCRPLAGVMMRPFRSRVRSRAER